MENAKKILIVDDEERIARAYRDHFTNQGYSAEVAKNGKEGLEKLESFSPDLVLLDIMMPEMDGLEMLKRVKENEAFRHIPIIILTNLDKEQTMTQATQYGSFLYFVKADMSLAKLDAWVSDVLGKK